MVKLVKYVKIVVYAPAKNAGLIRRVAAKSGAGRQGNYDSVSASQRSVGRFRPLKGAKPAIGKVGKIEAVAEERIEVLCERKMYKRVVKAIRKAHPYEEPAIEVYPLLYP